MLATQLIEARARQRGCMQACTIGLSINEDPKLEKGKEKKGSAARSFMRSLSHVSSRNCVYHNVYHNLPFSTSAVTISKRICVCHWVKLYKIPLVYPYMAILTEVVYFYAVIVLK